MLRQPSSTVNAGTGLISQHHRAVITSAAQPNPMVSVVLTPTTISATGEVATVYTLVPASHIGGGRGPVVTYTTSPSPSPKEIVMNSTPTAVELPRVRHHQQMGKALMSTAPIAVNNASTPRSPLLYTPAQQTVPMSCTVPASALIGHTQGGVVIVDSLPAQEIPKVPQREVVFCQQPLNSNGNATKSYAIVNTTPSGTPPPLPPPLFPPPPPLASKHPPVQQQEPRQVAVNGIPSHPHHPNRPPPPYQQTRQTHHFSDPTSPVSTVTHRAVASGPVIQDKISTHRGRTQHVMVDFGVDQLHDETSSELADHLRKLSSRYGKEFESLGKEKLMEIFHEAWKKFQSNGRKYDAFTKQQKTTRPSNSEVHASPPSTTPASSIVVTPTQRARHVIRGQQVIQTVPVQAAAVPPTNTHPAARPSSLPPLAPTTSAGEYVYAYATPEPLRQQPVIVPSGNSNQANIINLTDIPPPPLSSSSSSSSSAQQSRFQQIQTSGVFVPPPSPNDHRQQPVHGMAVVSSSTPATVVRSPHQRLLKPKPSTQSSVPAGYTRASSTSSTSSLSSSSSSSSVVLIQRPIVAPSEQDIALAAAAATHQPRSSAGSVGSATSVVVRTPSGSSNVGSRRRSSSGSNMKQSRVCALCGKDATYLCSGCHTEWYCSRDCQVRGHNAVCPITSI